MQYDYMIYPKQFRTAKIPVTRNYCFFLMPFHEKFDVVYGEVKQQLMDSGFICNRADELCGSKPIINKILVELLRAQYVIADLTDCNPNVFYELGIAHTFKDSQNVLLLKQKDSKVPFDITHLQYREYNSSNLKQLTSFIKEFIYSNQKINDFHEAIQSRGISCSSPENQEAFLDYIQNRLNEDIVAITKILNHHKDELDEESIETTLDRFQLLIHRTIDAKRDDILKSILQLYSELLISCSSYIVAETHTAFFLGDFFAQHKLSHTEIQSFQTDMAVTLAEHGKLLNIVMPWIIHYFSKSKAASIDLNRYKLEALLMTTEFEEVNRAIINAVFSSDCHIREHMADIIGEKQLYKAKDALCKQLVNEENYYTGVSIVEAIGKIGYNEGLISIENWTTSHEKDIVSSKMFSVFRHVYNSVVRLDVTPEGNHRRRFEELYGAYLSEKVPL